MGFSASAPWYIAVSVTIYFHFEGSGREKTSTEHERFPFPRELVRMLSRAFEIGGGHLSSQLMHICVFVVGCCEGTNTGSIQVMSTNNSTRGKKKGIAHLSYSTHMPSARFSLQSTTRPDLQILRRILPPSRLCEIHIRDRGSPLRLQYSRLSKGERLETDRLRVTNIISTPSAAVATSQ